MYNSKIVHANGVENDDTPEEGVMGKTTKSSNLKHKLGYYYLG